MVQGENALCLYAERLRRGPCHGGGGGGAVVRASPPPLASWFSSCSAVHPDIPAPLRVSFSDLPLFTATTPSSRIPFS